MRLGLANMAHTTIRDKAMQSADKARMNMMKRHNAKLTFTEFPVNAVVGVYVPPPMRKRSKTSKSILPGIILEALPALFPTSDSKSKPYNQYRIRYRCCACHTRSSNRVLVMALLVFPYIYVHICRTLYGELSSLLNPWELVRLPPQTFHFEDLETSPLPRVSLQDAVSKFAADRKLKLD